MQALKEAEIKKESIPVHMYQGQTAIQQLTDNDETTTLMVHTGNINETTTLCIPKEEEWRQSTSEDNDIGYIEYFIWSGVNTNLTQRV